jgi:hypothetical protein
MIDDIGKMEEVVGCQVFLPWRTLLELCGDLSRRGRFIEHWHWLRI